MTYPGRGSRVVGRSDAVLHRFDEAKLKSKRMYSCTSPSTHKTLFICAEPLRVPIFIGMCCTPSFFETDRSLSHPQTPVSSAIMTYDEGAQHEKNPVCKQGFFALILSCGHRRLPLRRRLLFFPRIWVCSNACTPWFPERRSSFRPDRRRSVPRLPR